MRKIMFLSVIAATALLLQHATAFAASDPIISELEVRVDLATAQITWNTDVTTTGLLEYGTTSGTYGYTKTTEEGTHHAVALSNLTEETQYYFRVTATDRDGNSDSTQELSFTTKTNSIKITRLEVLEHEPRVALIEMNTNRYAYLSLKYGTSPDALTSDPTEMIQSWPGGETHQIFRLTNLQPKTTYYFQVTAGQTGLGTTLSGIGILETSGYMKVTSIKPIKGKKGTVVTIIGKNFGPRAWVSSYGTHTDTAVGFGCALSAWPSDSPKCRGKITSWTDTKIVVQLNGGEKSGFIYVAKGIESFTDTVLNLVTVRGPKFTVK